ncbi:TolC family protein [Dyadobacter sp. LJ53]|uniref:TolC family protein n=1 Tax=Dyadobacter chenwenxiniae TaxID=2906456 RepID=UPI001F4646DF|nr:TolC family protein [Dyadobacter chenwenxiniae]MCF0050437.1 TolC family protein [Dyadobacter chenwenxiniae]
MKRTQMNAMIRWGVLLCTCLLVQNVHASNAYAPDTSKIFSIADLRELVMRNNPVIRQAGLLGDAARARVTQALGSFDPNLKASFDQKQFGGKAYYNHWTSELKVPLWLAGADLKVGFDRNVGTYTNPETTTPLSGLGGVGISVPIGQGLLIDARRNTLRQSRIMVDYAEAERVNEINKVWFQAVKDYWNWFYAHQQYDLIRRGVELANTRYIATRNQALLGDKPAIDSVEAFITVQERSIQLARIEIEIQNSRLLVSNHIWDEKGNPLELPADAIPVNADSALAVVTAYQLDNLLNSAEDNHPKLQMLRSKSLQLAIERNYLREMLKPKLNVSGSLLTTRRDFTSYVPEYYDIGWNNYKVGFDFSFPLFLRSARGKLNEIKVKQMDLTLDVQNETRMIRTNIRSSFNDLKAYQTQLSIQTQSITNQKALLRGELQKFDLGESTLFLINSRESKLIDMMMKQAELVTKYQQSLADLYYKAGMLQNE